MFTGWPSEFLSSSGGAWRTGSSTPAAWKSFVSMTLAVVFAVVEGLFSDDPQPLTSAPANRSTESRTSALVRTLRHGRGEAIAGENTTPTAAARRTVRPRHPHRLNLKNCRGFG